MRKLGVRQIKETDQTNDLRDRVGRTDESIRCCFNCGGCTDLKLSQRLSDRFSDRLPGRKGLCFTS